MADLDTHRCPICAEPFNPDDLCATDIEMGPCHAECLEGSPVVDLDTGEETGGKVDTYRFSEVMDPPVPAQNALAPVTAGQGVEVKPLEWRDNEATDGSIYYSYHGGRLYFGPVDDEALDAYPSLALAKAAAQADYERRIRSAIATPAQSKESE